MMRAVAILQLRQILAGKKIWLVILILAVPVALSALLRWGGGWESTHQELKEVEKI